MAIETNSPVEAQQIDPSVIGGGASGGGNGSQIASDLNDQLSKQGGDSQQNGVNSENGTGTGSAGLGDQSVDEAEPQSRGSKEHNSSMNGDQQMDPDLLQEFMEMLGLDSAKKDEGGSSCGGGGGSGGSGGAEGGGGSGGGGSGGSGGPSGGAKDGSGGSGGTEGGGGSDGPEPEGEPQAQSDDGNIKYYGTPEEAGKMKETNEQMMEDDPDYAQEVQDVIEKEGSINMTAKDLEGNTAGIAQVGGTDMAIDPEHLDNKDTIAHELLHLDGHGHTPEHDAAIEEAIDGK